MNFDTIIEYVDKAILKYRNRSFYDDLRNDLIILVATNDKPVLNCSERTFIDRTVTFGVRRYFRKKRKLSEIQNVDDLTEDKKPVINAVHLGELDMTAFVDFKIDFHEKFDVLTPRQKIIAQVIGVHSASVIAMQLNISIQTVQREIKKIQRLQGILENI